MAKTIKRIVIPPSVIEIWQAMDEQQKNDVADKAKQHVIDRAQLSGKGFNSATGRDKKFTKYTKEYAKFKGVSRGSVDLTLDDDMLKAMEAVKIKPSSFSLGYTSGNPEQGKAEGNITGSYGQSRGSSSKARPFLGLQKIDLERIIRDVDSQSD